MRRRVRQGSMDVRSDPKSSSTIYQMPLSSDRGKAELKKQNTGQGESTSNRNISLNKMTTKNTNSASIAELAKFSQMLRIQRKKETDGLKRIRRAFQIG